MKTAVIFRCDLLPISETFIRSQASSLKQFRPLYAGVERPAKKLDVGPESIVVMPNGTLSSRIRGRLFLHLGWAPGFYREIKERSPALVHAHFAPDAAIALPLVSRLAVPLIVTLHGYDATASEEQLSKGLTGRIYMKRRQALWRTASYFLCVSEFIRRKAIQAGYPEAKLRVHHIGIDRTFFVPQSQPRQRNTVLFIGRLVERKGCKYLIQAMQLVQRRYPDTKLVVIGDGPCRSSLGLLAREVRVSCDFLGSQPSAVVRDWLATTWLLCTPSVTGEDGACEGLPTVIAEAQATGVPVVGFGNGGIPEIVQHGETGLLAEERDYEALAQHLLSYLTDEQLWRASSSHALERIRQEFDLHEQTRLLEEIYQQAINEHVGR